MKIKELLIILLCGCCILTTGCSILKQQSVNSHQSRSVSEFERYASQYTTVNELKKYEKVLVRNLTTFAKMPYSYAVRHNRLFSPNIVISFLYKKRYYINYTITDNGFLLYSGYERIKDETLDIEAKMLKEQREAILEWAVGLNGKHFTELGRNSKGPVPHDVPGGSYLNVDYLDHTVKFHVSHDGSLRYISIYSIFE